MGALLGWSDSKDGNLLRLSYFRDVSWEHVLWSVNISAEFEVVDLVGVATVTVVPDEAFIDRLVGWHQVELLQDAQELALGDVQLL